MEFPTVGKNCSEPTCHRLDFLPVKCDACGGVYCHSHMSYNGHNCIEGKKRDFQVPVCPLCNEPIPSKRGQAPDIAVGAHIDADCESDKAKSRRKVYANRCNYKNCKKKEMMPLKCSQCGKNHCLAHRHPSDHECLPANSLHNQSNINQAPRPKPSADSTYRNKVQYVQGSMSEDEALARAIQLSLAGNNSPQVGETGRVASGSTQNNCSCVIN